VAAALRPARGAEPAEPALRLYLAPGRLFASGEDVAVTTILGSCVAVCLWDAEVRVGGMNHFLLPDGAPESPRFGRYAVPLLVRSLLELGARRSRLRAKLFGGACVLEAFRREGGHLGTRNVEMARERLRTEAIRVVEEDVGGELGRKLVFAVRTGATRARVIEART
jgi:chemotaxis protein CheD